MKEASRRNRKDSDTFAETPDFSFVYADSDSLVNEIAEWYTYSEEPEFLWNIKAFKDAFYKQHYQERKWSQLTYNERRVHVMRLLNQTDVNDKQARENVYRAVLYIAQGNFEECETIDEYNQNLLENVALLFDCDTFNTFIDLLLFEINNACTQNMVEAKQAPCILDNAELRVILSVLYTILEVVRCFDESTMTNMDKLNKAEYQKKYSKYKSLLRSELNKPLMKTNELLSAYLFQLVSKFCNQNMTILPIKKIILLLWKVLLFTLGGLEEAFKLKNDQRLNFGLPLITENPAFIISQMTPASPPPNPIDLVNELQLVNSSSSYKRKKNALDSSVMNGLTKQTKGIDSDDLSISNNGGPNKMNGSSSSANGANSAGGESSTGADGGSANLNDNIANLAESDAALINTFEDAIPEVAQLAADSEGSKSADVEAEAEAEAEATAAANFPEPLVFKATTAPEESDSLEIAEAATPYPTGSGSPPPEPSQQNSNNNTNNNNKSSPPPQTQSQAKVLEAAADSAMLKLQFYNQIKTLPWSPKVRLCELEAFLDQERKKFLGYGDLINDLDTLVGLPYPIHESVKILKQHLYISLAEEQIKLEEKLAKYPLSSADIAIDGPSKRCGLPSANTTTTNDVQDDQDPEEDGDDESQESPAEILYSSLLPNLPQYLICLLKILLTSVPQTRPKSDSLQIMCDLFPEDLLGSHFLTIKLGIDTNRHKEILIKAISGILLLMLKHFKVNHVYQFEFMSQHLLFANCVPLILKFFNLNIASFIQSKNSFAQLEFPNCVIGMQPEIDADELENGDNAPYRWRNVFSCINLLRILNKLTKYKRSRVMMLVIFKSAPILKKVLRIKQAMLQLYALKLLKMQTRHLGRQWRKTNMSTMSAIYQKVRHRLNDDWAFGNELEAQAWDFQADECALRTKIDRFNQRRYRAVEEPLNADYLPNDNSVFGCLSKEKVELPENFDEKYEDWLEKEVFTNSIDWDALLAASSSASSTLDLDDQQLHSNESSIAYSTSANANNYKSSEKLILF